jgi:GNAT superfamily N-acetyltransferase
MIDIQTLNKLQLEAFIASDQFKTMPDVPISTRRAIAQCHNPRAGADDILLLLAWLDGEMVGYLGVLPDWYFPAGNPTPCGWLSCLWVSDRHRGKSIAKKLVTQGAAAMGGHIVLTEFTPVAKQLYDKLGLFTDLRRARGIRLYFRLELERLLPPKHRFFEKTKGLLSLIDWSSNLHIDVWNSMRDIPTHKATWVSTDQMDAETEAFIADKQGHELFKRDKAALDWAIQHPWMVAGKPDEESRRYHFSSVDKLFRTTGLKVYDAGNTLCAFLILTQRNGTLKMPCCYLSNKAAPLAAAAILTCIRKWSINTFTTFHPEMVQYFETIQTFAWHKKALYRHYLATPAFATALTQPNFNIQDGDGDCFFT